MIDLANHSEADFDAVWRAHSDQLVRFAGALVGPDDAPDLAAEVLFASAEAILGGEIRNPTAFLYGAVSNRARDLKRARERRWRRDLHAVPPRGQAAPDTYFEVRQAIAQLSLQQRTVIFLIYWEDRTEAQIAEILKVSPGTVRRHIVRARAHLKKALR